MRRVLPLALGLAWAGCTAPARPPAGPAPAAVLPPPLPPVPAGFSLQPSPWVVVGRVLAVDPVQHTVIVDVSPYAELPENLSGRLLLARNPGDLHLTARLQASPFRRSFTLGTWLTEGLPVVGDEVVLPPAVAPAQ